MKHKVVIIDDEKHGTDILENLMTTHFPHYEILNTFNDSIEGLNFINSNEFDLLFLDIQMPKLNGFRLLENVNSINFDIIFTTAFDQYAIKAFEYSAFHYLLKPITVQSIQKVLTSWENRKKMIQKEQLQILKNIVGETFSAFPKKDTMIALPVTNGYQIVKIDDIIRCQSENNYTKFYMNGGEAFHLISRTLKEVNSLLEDRTFFRVHQSHLINSKFVESISREDGGLILMKDKSVIPVSRQRKELIQKILSQMVRMD